MITSKALKQAIHNLECSLSELNSLDTPQRDHLYWVERAERQLADIRGLVEAEPQAQALEQRYGTVTPPTIKDWWQA